MEPISTEALAEIVRNAVQEVFAIMLGMELKCGEAYVEKTAPSTSEGVVSLVGLAGQWIGTGCVACSAPLACRISSQMLMTEIESVGEEVLDAIAEVTNMIIGNVKTSIEESLGPMGLSIPTVVFGRNFTAKSAGDGDWTVVPFYHGDERLTVKVYLTLSRKPGLPVRPGFPHTCSLQG